MIRNARTTDLDSIMILVTKASALMLQENNPQWDPTYPTKADFQADIVEETLYVHETDGIVDGVLCVNFTESPQYQPISWAKTETAMVVHRMAVDPDSRGRGIGHRLLSFADEIARSHHVFYLKSDTYGANVKMNGLLQKHAYTLCGHLYFPGIEGVFNCYEKSLSEKESNLYTTSKSTMRS
ncbi:MAG: GNAT family N-acetyltransferase [Lachnospiraceae bacterium]